MLCSKCALKSLPVQFGSSEARLANSSASSCQNNSVFEDWEHPERPTKRGSSHFVQTNLMENGWVWQLKSWKQLCLCPDCQVCSSRHYVRIYVVSSNVCAWDVFRRKIKRWACWPSVWPAANARRKLSKTIFLKASLPINNSRPDNEAIGNLGHLVTWDYHVGLNYFDLSLLFFRPVSDNNFWHHNFITSGGLFKVVAAGNFCTCIAIKDLDAKSLPKNSQASFRAQQPIHGTVLIWKHSTILDTHSTRTGH